MKTLCIIPARGGSKRIPKKNIKLFLGQPILKYSIDAAVQSKIFDEVMVSTDDDEIAEVAINIGATVPFKRSLESSGDYATTFEVILEVVNNYSKKLNVNFDRICCIYPCAPFISSEKLINSYNLFVENKFDSVLPIVSFAFPIQRSLILDESGGINFSNPQFSLTRSQDLPKHYHDAGQFYWIDKVKCFENRSIITNNTGAIVVSELECQDIDNETDWKMAELKYLLKEKRI
jgi:pseudaminic acid cytidylyltransferase